MRKLATALLLLACLAPAFAASTLQFAGVTFLQKDEQKFGGRMIREYLPAGQTFEDYSQLLALRREPAMEFTSYARNIELELRKKFPDSTFDVLSQTPDNLELEFVLVSPTEGREYNLWHFHRVGEDQVSVQYVLRDRGAFARTFDQALKGRASWRTEMEAMVKTLEPSLPK